MFAERLGGPPDVADHAVVDLDPAVLSDIPRPWPVPEPDCLAATGRAQRDGPAAPVISH